MNVFAYIAAKVSRITMLDMAPRPRTHQSDTVTIQVDSRLYDLFAAAIGDRTVKASTEKVLRLFLSVPHDAQEVWLSDLTPENSARVIRAVLKSLKK